MAAIPEQLWPAVGFLAGIGAHLAFFNRGEHHMHGVRYMQGALVLFGLGVYIEARHSDTHNVKGTSFRVAGLAVSVLAGLVSSLLVYRAFLSPLCKFPGPFGARLTDLWLVFKLGAQDNFRQVASLHEKYGEFVRIGSNTISTTHVEAIEAVYGQKSNCFKADWYDLSRPLVSMQTTRSKQMHSKRRRVWSSAFSDKALRGYETRINKLQQAFMDSLGEHSGETVDATKWFMLYNYDVMGDLAFGHSFDMLESSEEHWAIKLLVDGIKPLGLMLPIWLFRIMTAIPGLSNDWWKFKSYTLSQMNERRKTEPAVPDIMSTLLEPFKENEPTQEDINLLHGDCELIVVAGSDTSTTTMTHILYELLKAPQNFTKLRDEIRPHVPQDGTPIPDKSLIDLPHLDAVIHETLRLYPPVPTALPRITPPEGLTLGKTYIPGGTVIICPQYAIGRQESIYPSAKEFIPERWYAKPNLLKDRSAFAPFSIGPYNCIGRPLAYMNIRTTLARLLMEFDVMFAEGQSKHEVVDTAQEHFVLAPGKLHVVFTKREKA